MARWAGSRGVVAGLVVGGLLSSACLVGPVDQEPEASAEPVPSASELERVDGTGSIEEFEEDFAGAVEVAEQYWGEQFSASGEQFAPIRQVVAYEREGEVACAGQPLPLNNAVYCSRGDFIAYDVRWAVGAFQVIGDAFLFYLLGHEYAHGVQARLGVNHEFTIQQELQADCMAGAYIGDSVRGQVLEVEPGDLDELREGLFTVGDEPGQPWFAEGSHGSPEQRTEAFFEGYERSLDACDFR